MMSPPRVLPVAERARLVTWIEALARTAARLPAGPRRGGATVAKHLLREQLVVAAVAAEAGDVILLDAALFAGQRLLAEPYRSPDSGGAALAAQLQGVRERLRGHMAAAGYPPLERLGAIAGQASPR
jgi:hypothetical protein